MKLDQDIKSKQSVAYQNKIFDLVLNLNTLNDKLDDLGQLKKSQDKDKSEEEEKLFD